MKTIQINRYSPLYQWAATWVRLWSRWSFEGYFLFENLLQVIFCIKIRNRLGEEHEYKRANYWSNIIDNFQEAQFWAQILQQYWELSSVCPLDISLAKIIFSFLRTVPNIFSKSTKSAQRHLISYLGYGQFKWYSESILVSGKSRAFQAVLWNNELLSWPEIVPAAPRPETTFILHHLKLSWTIENLNLILNSFEQFVCSFWDDFLNCVQLARNFSTTERKCKLSSWSL